MVNGVPCSRIPIVRTVCWGTLGNLKRQAVDAGRSVHPMGASLIFMVIIHGLLKNETASLFRCLVSYVNDEARLLFFAGALSGVC